MANICLYKVMVKGPKLNCYKLVDMMPLGDWEKDYLFEEGTDDNFTLIFIGGYFIIWLSIYLSIKAQAKKLNDKISK